MTFEKMVCNRNTQNRLSLYTVLNKETDDKLMGWINSIENKMKSFNIPVHQPRLKMQRFF
jgi:hypothetical protein